VDCRVDGVAELVRLERWSEERVMSGDKDVG
jgi:hypothetical protein